MSDKNSTSEEIDLVWAHSAEEAHDKVNAHYEAKSSEYSVDYSCSVDDGRSVIA